MSSLTLRETNNTKIRTFTIQQQADENSQKLTVADSTIHSFTSVSQFLREAFLPKGFPNTVTSDYVEYQIYDTAQAFCSSITGLLSTRAVLQGVGVGDANATLTGALMVRAAHEATARIGTILFAWRMSTRLDSECKTWRIAADVFNDLGMLCDLLAPTFPRYMFLPLTSLGTLLRAITSVAGGATRAALTIHFAKADNSADVSAKDSSQETVVSMTGVLFGSLLVFALPDIPIVTWVTFSIFTLLHLYTNFCAVRAVTLSTLNPQRASLVISSFLVQNTIPTPIEISSIERLWWVESRQIIFGVSFENVLGVRITDPAAPGYLTRLLEIFENEHYFLFSCKKKQTIFIHLHERANHMTFLRAFLHAHILLNLDNITTSNSDFDLVSSSLVRMQNTWSSFQNQCKQAGWDTSKGLIGAEDGTSWRGNWKISKRSAE